MSHLKVRRGSAIFLLMALLVPILAACGGSAPTTAEPTSAPAAPAATEAPAAATEAPAAEATEAPVEEATEAPAATGSQGG